eukprot:COSAG02_NODE_5493_length_4284_cov_1.722342_4_plen_119_part_00
MMSRELHTPPRDDDDDDDVDFASPGCTNAPCVLSLLGLASSATGSSMCCSWFVVCTPDIPKGEMNSRVVVWGCGTLLVVEDVTAAKLMMPPRLRTYGGGGRHASAPPCPEAWASQAGP